MMTLIGYAFAADSSADSHGSIELDVECFRLTFVLERE